MRRGGGCSASPGLPCPRPPRRSAGPSTTKRPSYRAQRRSRVIATTSGAWHFAPTSYRYDWLALQLVRPGHVLADDGPRSLVHAANGRHRPLHPVLRHGRQRIRQQPAVAVRAGRSHRSRPAPQPRPPDHQRRRAAAASPSRPTPAPGRAGSRAIPPSPTSGSAAPARPPDRARASPAATRATYASTASDVGRHIRVIVGAEGLGRAQATSAHARAGVRARPRPPPGALTPFPVLVIVGRLRGLTDPHHRVRGPRAPPRPGERSLQGQPLPVPAASAAEVGKRKRLRLRRAQRTFRAGQVLEIRVTGRNRIGKFTRVRFRRGRAAAAIGPVPAPGGQDPPALRGGPVTARLAFVALAAAGAFLGASRSGTRARARMPRPAPSPPPSWRPGRAHPVSRRVPVPATARLPGLQDAPAAPARGRARVP